MNQDITVIYEATPNPQSMRFIVGKMIAEETVHFTDPRKTTRSPLAAKLFGFPWAQGVLIGPNFVTVTKQEWVDWHVLADPLANLIQEHFESGEEALLPVSEMPEEDISDDSANANNADQESDSATVKLIKKILRTEIQPTVQSDGGDIAFHKYEDGVLSLELRGACNGCPSSKMTLKDGIEARLKGQISELREVVSVN